MPFSEICDAQLRDLIERGRAARVMSAIVRSRSAVLTKESFELRTRTDAATARSPRAVVADQ